MDVKTREKWLAAHSAKCVSEYNDKEYLFYLQNLVLQELESFKCESCNRVFIWQHEDERDFAVPVCAACGDEWAKGVRELQETDDELEFSRRR